MVLKFKVTEQTVSLLSTQAEPRVGSKGYLRLQFLFTSDWAKLTRVVYLQAGDVSVPVTLESDEFTVPEYFTEQSSFDVTLLGVGENVEVPTNVIKISLHSSNTLWESDAPEPTPSWVVELMEIHAHPAIPGENGFWMLWNPKTHSYEQSNVQSSEEAAAVRAQVSADEAALASDEAEKAAQNAVLSEQRCALLLKDTSSYAESAGQSSSNASQALLDAQSAAEKAASSEEVAGTYATQAVQAADAAKASENTALQVLNALDSLLLIDTVSGKSAITRCAAVMPIRKLAVNDGTEVHTVKVLSKNLFKRPYNAPVSGIGVTVEYDVETQEFVFNGTTTAAGDLKLVQPMNIDWVPGQKYTVSVQHTGGTASLGETTNPITYAWGIFASNASKFIRGSTALTEFKEIYNFTAAAFEYASYIFYFQCWRVGTVFDNYRVKVQLEHGSSVSDWEAYREVSAPFEDAQSLILQRDVNNVISFPQADITVVYVQDTKLYIDSVVAQS